MHIITVLYLFFHVSNWWAVIVCAVLSLIMGSIWYGPLFGKAWMRITGCTDMDMEKRKEMQRKAVPLYFIQFILTILQLLVLVRLAGSSASSGIFSAIFVWIGFILPTVAGSCMWTAESRKTAQARFLIQAGFQLVSLIVFGAILGAWH